MEFLLAVVTGLLAKAAADECGIGFKTLARWLVKSVTFLIDDRDRYEEQWLADLEDRKTTLRQLIFALGVLQAAKVLGRERPSSHANSKQVGTAVITELSKLDLAEQDARLLKEVLEKLLTETDRDSLKLAVRTSMPEPLQLQDLLNVYSVRGKKKSTAWTIG